MDCDMAIAFLLFFLFVYFQCVVINRIVSDSAAWSLELRFERSWGFWTLIYSQTWSREPPRIGFPETSIIILPQASYTHLTYESRLWQVAGPIIEQYSIQYPTLWNDSSYKYTSGRSACRKNIPEKRTIFPVFQVLGRLWYDSDGWESIHLASAQFKPSGRNNLLLFRYHYAY